MRSVEVRYGVTFGKCDASDWIDYEVELTDEEADAYDEAIESETPLADVPALKDALNRAYEEIEEGKLVPRFAKPPVFRSGKQVVFRLLRLLAPNPMRTKVVLVRSLPDCGYVIINP